MSKSEAKRIDIQMKAKLKEQQQQIDALKEELRLAREVVEAANRLRKSDGEIEYGNSYGGLLIALTDYEQSIKANSPAGEMKEK